MPGVAECRRREKHGEVMTVSIYPSSRVWQNAMIATMALMLAACSNGAQETLNSKVATQISDKYSKIQLEDCTYVIGLGGEILEDESGAAAAKAEMARSKAILVPAYEMETGETLTFGDIAARSSLTEGLTKEMMLTGRGTSDDAFERLNACSSFVSEMTAALKAG